MGSIGAWARSWGSGPAAQHRRPNLRAKWCKDMASQGALPRLTPDLVYSPYDPSCMCMGDASRSWDPEGWSHYKH